MAYSNYDESHDYFTSPLLGGGADPNFVELNAPQVTDPNLSLIQRPGVTPIQQDATNVALNFNPPAPVAAATPLPPTSTFPDTTNVPYYRETRNTRLNPNDTAAINRRESGRAQFRDANVAILSPIEAAKNAEFSKIATQNATESAYDQYGRGRVQEARDAMASEKASMAEYGVPMIKAKATGQDVMTTLAAHQDSLDSIDAVRAAQYAKPKVFKR